ncbi:MAG: hypothetical protein KAH98_02090 [Dehalococcoidia bacterium]|nr:hypothetical protein [Dehalococcoidia bacterium]MCK5653910.1 hypothetical protein [Dehalococcoidia bacterium]
MSLAELRDLFIVIYCILGIGATLFFVIITFLIFRRILAILNAGKTIVSNIRSITSAVSQDLVKPLASIASVAQGIAKVLDFVSDRRKEGRKGD